jgi:plasmid stabilization system protein ParE
MSKSDSLRGGRKPGAGRPSTNPETALAPAAEADRLAVHGHIEAGDPRAAEFVDRRIPARIPTLLQWPYAVAV